jgi:hypothetical protein
MSPKRFDIDASGPSENIHGDYVLFSDYDALAAELSAIKRTREQERDYANVCYENEQLKAAIRWVIDDCAYKAPEQMVAQMALRWIDRLSRALAGSRG